MLQKTSPFGALLTSLTLCMLGCSSEPTQAGQGGSSGTAGMGGGTGGIVSGTGTYTILSGDSAMLSMTPAPAAYETCLVCHATAGQGINLLAPEIRHAPLDYFTWITRNGRANTNMVAFGTDKVSDTDLAAIHAWLSGLPKPASGDQLYLDFCGNCHGPGGTGGAIVSNVRGAKTADLTSRVRSGGGTAPTRRIDYMPALAQTELSDAELGLIATYLGAM